MAFFKNLTDSLGIGGTKVDAKLDNSTVRAGDIVQGVLEIKGGKVERNIDYVYFDVYAECEKEVDDHKTKVAERIQRVEIPANISIQPKEVKHIPFHLKLHNAMPITTRKYKTWISTSLDIKGAIDPGDRDHIQVEPHMYYEAFLRATKMMGFTVKEVENEYTSSSRRKYEFKMTQEIDLRPERGSIYSGYLDELEVMALPQDDGILLFLEIDRKVRGLKSFFQEAVGLDESKASLFIPAAQLQDTNTVVALLRQKIDSYL